MEDVMQFLLVAGILAFGIFRQFNKEKNKKSEKGNSMPAPEYEYEPEFEEPVIIEKTYEQETTRFSRRHKKYLCSSVTTQNKQKSGNLQK